MWKRVLLALALGACSFDPQTAEGEAPPVPDGADPDDLDGDGVVEADNCPEQANADQVDGDGDLVGDACDNCPGVDNPPVATLGAAAPIQRDHDGDFVGDACDPCPHLAGVDESDGDGDGIGAACDPELAIPNPPALFDGFYDPPDATWEAVGGDKADWQVLQLDDGRIGWRQATLDGSRRHMLLLAGVRPEHYLESSVVVEQIAPEDPTSDLRSATLSYGYVTAGGDEFYFNCGIRRDVSGTPADVLIAAALRNDQNRDDAQTAWGGGLDTVHLVATGFRTGSTTPGAGDTDLACSANDGVTTERTVNTSTDIPDGRIGLRTFGMTAWFDYLFAVEPVAR